MPAVIEIGMKGAMGTTGDYPSVGYAITAIKMLLGDDSGWGHIVLSALIQNSEDE